MLFSSAVRVGCCDCLDVVIGRAHVSGLVQETFKVVG